MTLQIELTPEKQDTLRVEAYRRGVSVEAYAKGVLEENLHSTKNGSLLPPDEEERLFDELAELGKNIPQSLPAESYSRETIYAEHD